MLENIGEAAKIGYEKSVETFIQKNEDLKVELSELENTDLSNLSEEEIEKIENRIEEINNELEANSKEIAVQSKYGEMIVDSLDETVSLLAEEVRLQQLKAKLSALETLDNENDLATLKERLKIEKELLSITNQRIDKAFEDLSKTTGLTTDSLKSIIQNYAGTPVIDPGIYEQFSNNSTLQKQLTDWIEANGELFQEQFDLSHYKGIDPADLKLQNARNALAA